MAPSIAKQLEKARQRIDCLTIGNFELRTQLKELRQVIKKCQKARGEQRRQRALVRRMRVVGAQIARAVVAQQPQMPQVAPAPLPQIIPAAQQPPLPIPLVAPVQIPQPPVHRELPQPPVPLPAPPVENHPERFPQMP